MSRIVPIGILVFVPPAATDVVGYRLYWRDSAAPDPIGPLTYDDNFVDVPLAAVEPLTGDDAGKVSLNLGAIDWNGSNMPNDSMILFGLSSVDDAGNESDLVQYAGAVPFDQEAPDAPTELEFRAAS